jgi:hypothetical protein
VGRGLGRLQLAILDELHAAGQGFRTTEQLSYKLGVSMLRIRQATDALERRGEIVITHDPNGMHLLDGGDRAMPGYMRAYWIEWRYQRHLDMHGCDIYASSEMMHRPRPGSDPEVIERYEDAVRRHDGQVWEPYFTKRGERRCRPVTQRR